eukprot:CAMPEP_0168495754 /NCGR_PEP_ID=MMETSP0228-20121227/71908_1 /TAXON_ID=133427 /ORGANISM="Protoceratium reticulatum, Strain CCCM 535 (=CCMP 1889)" /LENGTH=67 /DNA_ID=CAMNT_0008512599 /DNA_START=17 /DNA_END=217 /DNA_ORIENTATION=-
MVVPDPQSVAGRLRRPPQLGHRVELICRDVRDAAVAKHDKPVPRPAADGFWGHVEAAFYNPAGTLAK